MRNTVMIPELGVVYSEGEDPLWLVVTRIPDNPKLELALANGSNAEEVRSMAGELGEVVYVERLWHLIDRARMLLTVDKSLGIH